MRRPAGFSLVELLVVLVLIGLLAGIALPNLQRLYGGVVRNTERDHILDQIAGLGREAMLNRRDYVVFATADPLAGDPDSDVADYQPYPLDIPDGWRLRLDRPLVVRANGVCLGAEVTLLHADAAPFAVNLVAPYCRVAADA